MLARVVFKRSRRTDVGSKVHSAHIAQVGGSIQVVRPVEDDEDAEIITCLLYLLC